MGRTFKLIFAWVLIISETISKMGEHYNDAYNKYKHLIPEPLPEEVDEEEQNPEGVVDVVDAVVLNDPATTFKANTPEEAERNLDIE